jgi:hypothetical protein
MKHTHIQDKEKNLEKCIGHKKTRILLQSNNKKRQAEKTHKND